MITRIWLFFVALFAGLMGSAQKASADMAALFTAVDVSAIETNVQTILLAFISIGLLFLGYRYIRRSGVR